MPYFSKAPSKIILNTGGLDYANGFHRVFG